MLMLKNVRISYPELFKKVAFKDGTPKYSGTFLLKQDQSKKRQLKPQYLKSQRKRLATLLRIS